MREGVELRTDHQPEVCWRVIVPVGLVDHERGFRFERLDQCVGDNRDDSQWLSSAARQFAPDRFPSRPQGPGCAFADDDRRRRRSDIVKDAPLEHRNAHRRKVTGARPPEVREWTFQQTNFSFADGGNIGYVVRPSQRRERNEPSGNDARYDLDSP